MTTLLTKNIKLRPLALADIQRLASIANNRNISINLRDGFPFPYTEMAASMSVKMGMRKPLAVVVIHINEIHSLKPGPMAGKKIG